MKLSNREQEIREYIYNHTEKQVKKNNLADIGQDAQTISNELFLDRANVSRMLNKLCRENLISKILGRPSLFFSKEVINNHYPNFYCSDVFPTKNNFLQSINEEIEEAISSIDPFKTVIGYNTFESLYMPIQRMKAAIAYPNNPLPCIIFGDRGTGKQSLIMRLFEYGMAKNIFRNTSDFVEFNCQDIDINDIVNDWFKNKKCNNKMIVFYNFENLNSTSQFYLGRLLSNLSMYKNYNCSIVLATSSSRFAEKFKYRHLVPLIIKIPTFEQRTIKERMCLVLDILQKEADNINRTIQITKNVLNCFIMSIYKENIFELKREIKIAIATALLNHNKSPLEITFDDLSDELLIHIANVNNHIDELSNIYSLLNKNYFAITPHVNSPYRKMIFSQLLYISKDQIALVDSNEALKNEITTIYELCSLSIKKAFNTPLTTLTASSTRDYYYLLNETLSNESFTKNDQLYSGLLTHISEVIESLKKLSYQYYKVNNLKLNPAIMTTLDTVENLLNTTYNVELPEQEKYFLSEYISLANCIAENHEIPLLLIFSNPSTTKNYSLFIDSLKTPVKHYSIDIGLYNFVKKKNELIQLLNKMESTVGILVLTDERLSDEIMNCINEHCTRAVYVENTSIHTIPQILKKLEDKSTLIEDFRDFNNSILDESIDMNNLDILDLIRNEILIKSLSFLNPDKVMHLAKESFDEIINDLDIIYDDILMVKYIVHMAFVVERIIRNQPASYKKVNEFVRTNGDVLKILEKNVEDIENQFGIKIPLSELVYLCQIFIGAMENNRAN